MAFKKSQADILLNEAYESYRLDITKFCAVRLREDKSAIDDCVQEAFLVYYNKLLHGEEIFNVRAFLYKAASLQCKAADNAFLRKAKRNVDLETVEEVAAVEVDEKAADLDYDILKDLLLKELTEEEQTLYALKYVQNKSLKEISALLDITPNAVANRTSRLRTKVKSLVSPIINKYAEGGVVL